MNLSPLNLKEDYWQSFAVQPADLEVLTTYLLDIETPLGPAELVAHMVAMRLQREQEAQSAQRTQGGEIYLPKDKYQSGQKLVFAGLDWQAGEVASVRPAKTFNGDGFEVLKVEFEDGQQREFASGLADHSLNNPPELDEEDPDLNPQAIVETHGGALVGHLEEALKGSDDFVYIAGRWFPKALIVDVGEGQLNLAEALLDMQQGGPLPTESLLQDVELPDDTNPKLAAFSLDLALQEDERFDEVGPSGEVAWFLHRLEPETVRQTPVYLCHQEIDHDRALLSEEMLDLERRLEDELSPITEPISRALDEVEARLIYPHWRAGTLPLTGKVAELFPTAYESPRVHFDFVDEESGDHFPGWVVRTQRYIHGLREWYEAQGLMPGSFVRARRGENPGEIVVSAPAHRSSKEWVRTALIGADGGVVYAMLKQTVESAFDERMMIFMPSETQALDAAWEQGKRPAFEQVVADCLQELAKLNPQSHVHASELYSVVNVVLRVPPAPILALLADRPWFQHVGDLHFRLSESQVE